jgi:hypothetical protein
MPASAGVVGDIVSTIEMRTVGAFNDVYLFPLAATARTFLRALNRGGVIVPLLILAAVAHYAATVSRIDWRGALWLWTPALVAAVWFEALSSHTQFHLTVSSRSAAMALAILLSAAVVSMQKRPSLGELWAQLANAESQASAASTQARPSPGGLNLGSAGRPLTKSSKICSLRCTARCS